MDATPSAPYLAATVARAADRFGDRPAFVEADGRTLTYSDLHRESDEIAAGLARRGIGVGAVVALTLPSTIEWVLAHAAISKIGATEAGVNPRLTDTERRACLDRVEPELALEEPDAVRGLAVRGGRPDPVTGDDSRPAAIVFTSGTTGLPKGVVFTDRQLRAITGYDTGGVWGGDDPIPQIGSTQFAHVGFTTKLPWYLQLGTTTHLLDRWRASTVLDLVERERIRTLGAVAPQVALLLRDPDFDRRDLTCVDLIVAGAAASPPALVAEARRRFDAGYSVRWSSTESGGVGTGTDPAGPDEEILHTAGRPRPGMGLEVRADDGTVLPSGEVGRLWLRSGAVMEGYWADPDATAETIVDGWLDTGDLGHLDEAGRLIVAGRSGDMFIRGGYNIHPAEVSGVLGGHPGVAEVEIVPRPDPVLGHIGVAVVVPADPADPPTLESLRDHAGSVLSHHKLPEAMVVVDELPLTSVSKVDRRSLTQLVSEEHP